MMKQSDTAVNQLKERFRREAIDNKEATIGRIAYTQIQIYGEVSYKAIRKSLHKMIEEAPSKRGDIIPELDTHLLDAEAALVFLLQLHEPHDDH